MLHIFTWCACFVCWLMQKVFIGICCISCYLGEILYFHFWSKTVIMCIHLACSSRCWIIACTLIIYFRNCFWFIILSVTLLVCWPTNQETVDCSIMHHFCCHLYITAYNILKFVVHHLQPFALGVVKNLDVWYYMVLLCHSLSVEKFLQILGAFDMKLWQ